MTASVYNKVLFESVTDIMPKPYGLFSSGNTFILNFIFIAKHIY